MTFLGVLKIIGIVLAAILCVMLTIVLMLLFIPVIFKADAAFYDEKTVSGSASWLGPVIRARFYYGKGGFSYSIKVLFFTIKQSDEPGDKKSDEPADKKPDDTTDAKPDTEHGKIKAPPPKADAGYLDDAAAKDEAENKDVTAPSGDTQDIEKEPRASNFGAGLKDMLNGDSVEALKLVLAKVKKLLSHIRFRILKGDIDYSAGDPAYTGYTTGLISLLPAAYGRKLRICPDFEAQDAYIRGYLKAGGHFFLVYAAVFALTLLFNRDIRRFFRRG